MRVADCQGFAGGFTMGAVQAGLELVVKVENTGGFGMAQCEANRALLGNAWLPYVDTADTWPDVGRSESVHGSEVVIANPPCSGFSVMSKPAFRGMASRINSCMWDAVTFAAAVKPQVYVMESVRPAFTKGLPLMRQLRAELERLTGDQYTLHHVVQDNYSLGGCSKRGRYFMVCSKVPFGVEIPELQYRPTLADAIGDLVDQPLSWEYQPYHTDATWWSAPFRSEGIGTDGHDVPPSGKTSILLDLMDDCERRHWVEGLGEGRASKRYYEAHGTLPPTWHAKIKKVSQKSLAAWAIDREFNFGMFQTGRWFWGQHARVITGAGPLIGIHPINDRYFTHRETARIMGFPDDWVIAPLQHDKTLVPGWGKGVSVHAGRWISEWAKSSIEGKPGTEQEGRLVDSFNREWVPEPREYVHDVSKAWKQAPLSPTYGVLVDAAEEDEPVEIVA